MSTTDVHGPRAPFPVEIAEDEGFETFIMGMRVDDNPYRFVNCGRSYPVALIVAWDTGWRMAMRYHGR